MTIRMLLAPVLAAITFGAASAQAQAGYSTIVRHTSFFSEQNLAADVQQSSEVVVPFVSRHGLVGGVAVAYVTIPVCGGAGTQANSELGEVPGSTMTSIEKMGGPLHVFFKKQVSLTTTSVVPRGVAIADVCRRTMVTYELTCGSAQTFRSDSISSIYRADAEIEGFTCRFEFPQRQISSPYGNYTGFVDVTLTYAGAEVMIGL